MAGIVGMIGVLRKEDAAARVDAMLASIAHEPFYSTGTYRNEEMGVSLGWAVHPGSFSDSMPATSDDGQVALVFHGEVFTGKEEMELLRDRADDVSVLDAGHLVHLYDVLGERFFESLNGTFCGVLIDGRRHRVVLFNDRLGFEKVYYTESGDGPFCFASEAKALLRIEPGHREFDRAGLAQFVAYGCTFDETTLYKGVSLLPPASRWTFEPDGTVHRKTYFTPEDWAIESATGIEDFEQRIGRAFREAVPRYLTGKLRAGLSLTGGWDTRMIVACGQAEPGTLPCYTFGGLGRDTVDVRQARKVARALGQEHSVLRLGSDFLRDFSDHAAKTVYVSDGYGHVGLSHEIYLNRLAREIAGVRVTGNFGSEILRGVTTFKALPGCLPWPTEIEAEIGRCKEQWKTFRNGNEARFATFREVPMLLATTTRLAASQLPVRSPFLDNEVVRLACACPPAVRRKSSVALSLIEGERPELLRIMTDRGAGRTRLALTGALREAWYFNMFRLEYFLNEGMPDLLGGVLDPLGVGSALPMRHKYLHYRQWFRGPLQPYLRETLGSPGAFVRSVMEPAAIERLLSDHARGLRNNETPINTLVTLELIESRILRAH